MKRFTWLLMPVLTLGLLTLVWDRGVVLSKSDIFPRPFEVVRGLGELISRGLLLKYAVASLFRVSIGFTLAVLVGVPAGLVLGWFRPAFLAFNPLIQILRPISPIAWIPIAILWFHADDRAPIFLIFLASAFPIVVSAVAAVQNIQSVYVRAARNFGLNGFSLFRRVIFPACLPRILTGLRIALGIAWLVVVAAEMIAVNQGRPVSGPRRECIFVFQENGVFPWLTVRDNIGFGVEGSAAAKGGIIEYLQLRDEIFERLGMSLKLGTNV